MDKMRLADLATGPANETAIDAITRYHAFLDALFEDDLEASESLRLRFYTQVTLDQVRTAEQRLGLTLPPSYVTFVTEHGLFSGPGDEAILRRPENLGLMYDYFLEEVFSGVDGGDALAFELGTDLAGVERLRKIVYFADGQYEEMLDLFRIDAANEQTLEAPIDLFDREDYYAYDPIDAGFSGRSIDRHVIGLVDFNIRRAAKLRQVELPVVSSGPRVQSDELAQTNANDPSTQQEH